MTRFLNCVRQDRGHPRRRHLTAIEKVRMCLRARGTRQRIKTSCVRVVTGRMAAQQGAWLLPTSRAETSPLLFSAVRIA
jgi:hypothetical protein